MRNKTVLITGANSGIGLETLRSLAGMGPSIVMACRDISKSSSILKEVRSSSGNIRIHLMELDLASMDSIKNFVEKFKSSFDSLDILINNAGVFCDKHSLTAERFEKTMGINYFGTVLLTELLLPHIQENGRIINLVSRAGFYAKLDTENMDFKRGFSGFKAYSTSKLALIMYNLKLSKQLETRNISVNAAHPGNAATNIWQGSSLSMKIMSPIMKKFAIKPQEAAQTSIYLASSEEIKGITGEVFHKKQILTLPSRVSDPKKINELWNVTRERLKLKGL